jgi:acetyltransferase-like isoleucine patch superfamily enzyme
VGARTRLGERSVIVALAGVQLGEDAVLGDWAVLADAGPAPREVERPLRLQPLDARPIAIGDGARIGAHAVLGAGATVRAGEAVGSYAVVGAPLTPA